MPYTEKLDYRIGDAVRWRVVNLSYIQHAMHLHVIYFKVVASENAQPHVRLADQPMAVTQVVASGETFEMQWTPERVGNWLFHCNMVGHMSPIPEKFSMPAVRFSPRLGVRNVVGFLLTSKSYTRFWLIPECPRRTFCRGVLENAYTEKALSRQQPTHFSHTDCQLRLRNNTAFQTRVRSL
jgi:Multicopper oxidase